MSVNSCLFFHCHSNRSTPRSSNSGRRRNIVSSIVTVGDSDEEQKTPLKNPVIHSAAQSNHAHHANQNTTVSSTNSRNASNNHVNANLRDVKPEIITSYASQKKRLLAKAQSECLIGLKQEPGLDSAGSHQVDHGLKYSVSSSNISSNNNSNNIKNYHSRYARDLQRVMFQHLTMYSLNFLGLLQGKLSSCSSSWEP